MDHEAYENEMIDAVNRNAEAKSNQLNTGTPNGKVITKRDKTTLKRGFKRTLLALLTAVMFAISVFGFIATATAQGYLAVAVFITSIAMLGCGFIFLYAQGIGYTESQGESK